MLKIYNAYSDMNLVRNNGTDYNKIKQQQLMEIWDKERTEAKQTELVSLKINEDQTKQLSNRTENNNETKQQQLMYAYNKENAFAKQTEAITGKISEVSTSILEKNNRREDIINSLYKTSPIAQEPKIINKVR